MSLASYAIWDQGLCSRMLVPAPLGAMPSRSSSWDSVAGPAWLEWGDDQSSTMEPDPFQMDPGMALVARFFDGHAAVAVLVTCSRWHAVTMLACRCWQ